MKSMVSRTVSSVSPGKPVINDPKVRMPAFLSWPIPRRVLLAAAALLMFLRMVGEPDSMPRNTPLQPLSAIRSIASWSELLQRK